jgi:hypothetical protein
MTMMGAPIGFQQVGPTSTLAPMLAPRPHDALCCHRAQCSRTHISTYAAPARGRLALALATPEELRGTNAQRGPFGKITSVVCRFLAGLAGLLADVYQAVVTAVFPIAVIAPPTAAGRLRVDEVVLDFVVTDLYVARFANVASVAIGPTNDMVVRLVMVRHIDGASGFLNNYRLSLANEDGVGRLLWQSSGLLVLV